MALLLIAILHFLTDADDPRAIVATLRDALPPGSYLALSHGTADFDPEAAAAVTGVYQRATSPATLRSRAQVAAFFDGFELAAPGLVQVPLWRPDTRRPRAKDLAKIWIYGGVGRLPG